MAVHRRALACVALALTSLGAAACSNGASQKPASLADTTSKTSAAAGSTQPATAPATTTTAPPVLIPAFTANGLKAALLQPADLGAGWHVETADDAQPSKAAPSVGWGCDTTARQHAVGTDPSVLDSLALKILDKSGTWTGSAFFSERYVLFKDEATATSAVDTLLAAPMAPCLGTHRHPADVQQGPMTSTIKVTPFSGHGFTGSQEYWFEVGDGSGAGANEVVTTLARRGPVLFWLSITYFHTHDQSAYRADFAKATPPEIDKALAKLAASGKS